MIQQAHVQLQLLKNKEFWQKPGTYFSSRCCSAGINDHMYANEIGSGGMIDTPSVMTAQVLK
jgi:hypothetical protein